MCKKDLRSNGHCIQAKAQATTPNLLPAPDQQAAHLRAALGCLGRMKSRGSFLQLGCKGTLCVQAALLLLPQSCCEGGDLSAHRPGLPAAAAPRNPSSTHKRAGACTCKIKHQVLRHLRHLPPVKPTCCCCCAAPRWILPVSLNMPGLHAAMLTARLLADCSDNLLGTRLPASAAAHSHTAL